MAFFALRFQKKYSICFSIGSPLSSLYTTYILFANVLTLMYYTETNMPITKSAKKALRQSKARRVGNLKRINGYKIAVKQFNKLVVAGKLKEAEAILDKVYQSLDKATKAGVIKANKASRLKSHAIKSITKK